MTALAAHRTTAAPLAPYQRTCETAAMRWQGCNRPPPLAVSLCLCPRRRLAHWRSCRWGRLRMWLGNVAIAIRFTRQDGGRTGHVKCVNRVSANVRNHGMTCSHQLVAKGALQVVSISALGRPAFSPSHPVPPSPTPLHPFPAPLPVRSSCVAASKSVVSRVPATHGAMHVNVVRDVGVHAEREARVTSGTPTSPSRVDQVSVTVHRNVVVVAKAARDGSVATTTLTPCIE